MELERTAVESEEVATGEEELLNRRDFLDRLGKWSKIVTGAVIFGSALLQGDHDAEASSWINRSGGGWVNRGGGSWSNRGGWNNRGPWNNWGGGGSTWVNRGGGSTVWANRGNVWANHGNSWINRF